MRFYGSLKGFALLGLVVFGFPALAEVWVTVPDELCASDSLKVQSANVRVGISLQGDDLWLQGETSHAVGLRRPGLIAATFALDRELQLEAESLKRLEFQIQQQAKTEALNESEVPTLPAGHEDLIRRASQNRVSNLNKKIQTAAQNAQTKVFSQQATRTLLNQLKEGRSDAELSQVLALLGRLSFPLELESADSAVAALCSFSRI